ncbi:MAG TPA: GH1 family beta-glucosidase [Candidatus Acidoferrales bacterium]|nr:GH1 family beta-glucosidase [Candidatus Acidoferrales bacterium]
MVLTLLEVSGVLRFPDGFLWGAATSAYQIEGGHDAGGKGASIWDTFAHTPAKIFENQNGDVACDHYHRFRDDVAIMADLGLNAYRFSISWPRVIPHGTGAANQRGLDFYSTLVDALVERKIRPFITLYHWDLPQGLEDRGGWGARYTAAAFGDYAALMGRTLGDRVKDWITLNEPLAVTAAGYIFGILAPGKQDLGLAFQVSHHLNLAHGHAVRALRGTVPGAHVGITQVSMPVYSASDSEADRQAARRYDGLVNRWYWEPPLRGAYPGDVLERLGPLAPKIEDGDLQLIAPPIDFFGHNSYTRAVVKDDPSSMVMGATQLPPEGKPQTAMGWEIYPDHLYDALTRASRDYGGPDIYITENGAAFEDAVVGGVVDDPQRTDYLRTHLVVAHRAIHDGVKLRGYFCWSLLDNFEWAFGYSKRFGIVHVDFATQRRLIKASGRFYSAVARQNGLP